MTYNQKKHIEFLKRSQELKNQGKSLYRESKGEDSELSKYDAIISILFFWQERYNLTLSMEDFLNRKIDREEFFVKVDVLRKNLINEVENFQVDLISGKVTDFQPEEGSPKLSGFLTGCFCCCDDFR